MPATDIDFTPFGPGYGNPEADIDRFEADIEALADLPYCRLCSSPKSTLAGPDRTPLNAFRRGLRRQDRQALDLCDPPHNP